MGLGGVVGSFQNDLLIFRGDLLPHLFAHDQNVGDHGVLVNRVDLAHFAVLAGGQCGFVVYDVDKEAFREATQPMIEAYEEQYPGVKTLMDTIEAAREGE